MRRLVVLSALLVLAGLALLLPSSPLYSIITTGSTTSSLLNSFGSTNNASTYESIVGFGLICVGVVLELFSLFTDVGAAVPGLSAAHSELEALNPAASPPTTAKPEEKP